MLRMLFRVLGLFFLVRAMLRGPAYLARFLVRRALYRSIRRWL